MNKKRSSSQISVDSGATGSEALSSAARASSKESDRKRTPSRCFFYFKLHNCRHEQRCRFSHDGHWSDKDDQQQRDIKLQR